MTDFTQGSDKTDMLKAITQAAQKRFGQYGLEKTTMNEIASDLSMSKASLYYYFPDKESLYKAVVEKEQEEFLKVLKKKLETIEDPADQLKEFVNIRTSYFRSLLNLGRFRLEDFKGIRPIIISTREKFREKEAEIINGIFAKGVEKGIFSNLASPAMADIFLDLLWGIRHKIMAKKEMFFLDQSEYKILEKRTSLFINVFINGLKYRL